MADQTAQKPSSAVRSTGLGLSSALSSSLYYNFLTEVRCLHSTAAASSSPGGFAVRESSCP